MLGRIHRVAGLGATVCLLACSSHESVGLPGSDSGDAGPQSPQTGKLALAANSLWSSVGGAGGSDDDGSGEAGAGWEIGEAGARHFGDREGAGGSAVQDCAPLGSVTPFDCNVELCAPSDMRTVSEAIDISALHDELRALLLEWVDESCLEECEPTMEEECVETGATRECESATCTAGACTTRRRAFMEYSKLHTTSSYYEDEFEEWSSTTTESIIIRPAGDESFSEITYHRKHSVLDGWFEQPDSTDVSVVWKGTLRPDWPSDFNGDFSFHTDVCQESGWEMHAASCDATYFEDCQERSLTREDQRLSVDSKFEDGDELWFGYMNGECLGEVDPETLEIVGPCR